MKRWKTLKSRYLLRRWWMSLREDHVVLPNGVELPEYHIAEYPDWACVVCLTTAGELVMVEQYRYAAEQVSLEFAAGAIEPGEAPETAARRELLEETGYVAEQWTLLGRCAQDPSRQTNWAYLYVAQEARQVQAPVPDAAEELHLRVFSPEAVLEKAHAGEIIHGFHILALLWAQSLGLLAGRAPAS